MFSLIFLSKNIENSNLLSVLYFILPSSFLIDYIFIFFNMNEYSFSDYYNFLRYEYFSGYFIFSLIFIFIFIKSNFKFSE